jgi:hypothetical protein
MRQLAINIAMVAAALLITFAVGAYLEATTFRAGPEPGVGAPSGTTSPPGERRGRARHVA